MAVNLGNVVGLVKGLTPPTKPYVLWGKILDISDPNKVELRYFAGGGSATDPNNWLPLTGGLPIVTGSHVYVDPSAANATDNRTGISMYDMGRPFLTMQAALTAIHAVYENSSDHVTLTVRGGTYNKVALNGVDYNLHIILDNVNLTGTTNLFGVSASVGSISIKLNEGTTAEYFLFKYIGQVLVEGTSSIKSEQSGSVVQQLDVIHSNRVIIKNINVSLDSTTWSALYFDDVLLCTLDTVSAVNTGKVVEADTTSLQVVNSLLKSTSGHPGILMSGTMVSNGLRVEDSDIVSISGNYGIGISATIVDAANYFWGGYTVLRNVYIQADAVGVFCANHIIFAVWLESVRCSGPYVIGDNYYSVYILRTLFCCATVGISSSSIPLESHGDYLWSSPTELYN